MPLQGLFLEKDNMIPSYFLTCSVWYKVTSCTTEPTSQMLGTASGQQPMRNQILSTSTGGSWKAEDTSAQTLHETTAFFLMYLTYPWARPWDREAGLNNTQLSDPQQVWYKFMAFICYTLICYILIHINTDKIYLLRGWEPRDYFPCHWGDHLHTASQCLRAQPLTLTRG